MKSVLLIHHSANRGALHPPGSLPALEACLEANARVVEIDLSPTADGDFALLHGPLLEDNTTGLGPITAVTAAQIRELRHVWRGAVTDVPIGLLDQALDLLGAYPDLVELQLDLKPDSPILLDDGVLAHLVERLQPVKDRVRVTSVADWLLRRLRALDAELPLGFDPLLYLDVSWDEPGDRDAPPFRQGAYGYLDEHPLASRRWGSPADYLSARAESLWVQAPAGVVWYVRAWLLGRSLDDGFGWIADLHDRGAQVVAWTLDPDKPEAVALARRLASLGVDRITTNNAPALALMLGVPAVY
jgi:glycerophosphoryl diester phosphodiesterase